MSSRVKFSREGIEDMNTMGDIIYLNADSWTALRVSISELDGTRARVLALKALTNR